MGRLNKLMRVPYRAAHFAYLSSTRSWRETHHPEIPTQPRGRVFASVCLDELALALAPRPGIGMSHEELSRSSEELDDALAILEANDCLDAPANFHRAPPLIEDLVREPGKLGPLKFEVLRFNSGYQSLPDMPGLHRWQAMESNCHVHAYLLEHRDGPRPWILNLHPFGGGSPFDLVMMRSLRMHRELGYNVLHPVFPLHGDRRPSPVDPACTILGFDLVNTIHFISNGIWDLRRMLGWVRNQDPTSVSLHGISLGAYAGAVLTGLEEFDRAVLGVGAVDLPAAKDYLLAESEHATVEDYDLVGERARALFRVISPSSLGCRVPPEGRFVYGAVGDRFAPGGAYELWKLWGQPSVHWHAGGHLTATMAPRVWRYIFDALTG
jgi:hypothetical protein